MYTFKYLNECNPYSFKILSIEKAKISNLGYINYRGFLGGWGAGQ